MSKEIKYRVNKFITKKDTEQYHIFQTKKEEDCPNQDSPKLTFKKESLCNKIKLKKTKSKKGLKCLSEQEIRKECADLGRVVCGTCISHMYGDF